jgi:hypothetical protein
VESSGLKGRQLISTAGIAMSSVLEKTKEEFFAILPPTIFFFVTLHVIAVIRVLMAKGSLFSASFHHVDCDRCADPG